MKHIFQFKVIISLAVLAIFFSGCSMPADYLDDQEEGLRLFINCSSFTERSFSPNFESYSLFPKYYITLTREGNSLSDYVYTLTGADRDNPKLPNVTYGKYTIVVRAYQSAGDSILNYSAMGTIVHTYNNTPSGLTARIILSPLPDEGMGTLKYKINDSAGITSYPILMKYSDYNYLSFDYNAYELDLESEDPYFLIADGGAYRKSLPAGYYALVFRNDVFHIVKIYKNFETIVELEIETTDKTADPVASIAGGEISYGTEINLSCTTPGAQIYYTTNGADPTVSGTLYTEPITITTSPLPIKAYAVKEGINCSDTITQTYTIKIDTPIASLPVGALPDALAKGTLVTLSCDVPGVSIYYTTNGDTPTASSTLYTSPIPINADMTLKAIGIKSGMTSSELMTVSYTLIVYTVTFDANYPEGNPTYSTKTASDGSSLGSNMPLPPERDGWIFSGWNKAAGGGGTIFDETTLLTGDITVYAQWEEDGEPGE